MGGFVEPAGQGRVADERGRLSRERGEDRLGHVVCPMDVATDLPQRGRVHQGELPPDQFMKGVLGTLPDIAAQEFDVFHGVACPIIIAGRSETGQEMFGSLKTGG